MHNYILTAPSDCWKDESLHLSFSLRVSLSVFNNVHFHHEWEPFVTPLNVFPFFCCVVPAPDVRYYLQLELDQPRQMLRPASHSKNKCHFKILWRVPFDNQSKSKGHLYVHYIGALFHVFNVGLTAFIILVLLWLVIH